jgi:hypothetical protein
MAYCEYAEDSRIFLVDNVDRKHHAVGTESMTIPGPRPTPQSGT